MHGGTEKWNIHACNVTHVSYTFSAPFCAVQHVTFMIRASTVRRFWRCLSAVCLQLKPQHHDNTLRSMTIAVSARQACVLRSSAILACNMGLMGRTEPFHFDNLTDDKRKR